MQKTVLILGSALAILLGSIGCVPKSTIVLPNSIQEPDNLLIEPSSSAQNKKQNATTLLNATIDSLIKETHVYCNQNDYTNAHQTLLTALDIIEQSHELPDRDNSNNSVNSLEAIAELYASLFPSEYLDSLPANIASIIFQYQISEAIDTLSIPPDDSSIFSFLACENGIPYNIPIVHNERVHHALYYIVKKRSQTMETLLSRAYYYLPLMQRYFLENNLPTDLTFLPILESGFNPKAYSYAHASGIWQFIQSTGKIYGLRNNYWIDERRDPIKSTHAAIRYLTKLYNQFGDWYLALAAYNCGERNVEKAIKKAGTNDYWQLKLHSQTMNYVPQFIAYQIVGKNPQCFEFHINQPDTFNFDTVHVSDCVDLNKIASGINLPFNDLKKMNPHITQWCTPPDMNDVVLYLPNGLVDTFKTFYETLDENDKVRWYRYRIKSGDNLLSIAHRFNIAVPAIQSINKLRGNFIVAGRYLYIPLPANGTNTSSLFSEDDRQKTSQANNESNTTIATTHTRYPGDRPIRYKLSAGETIANVSELFNVKIAAIPEWNNITNPRSIAPGTVLTLYVQDVPDRRQTSARTQESLLDTSHTGKSGKAYVVNSGDNLFSIAQKLGISIELLAAWNNKNLENPLIKPGEELVYYSNDLPAQHLTTRNGDAENNQIKYKIKKGETLYSLAVLFSVPLQLIYSANNLEAGAIIHPGDIIIIPNQSPALSNRTQNRIPNIIQNQNGKIVYYKVEKGDNLWSIADIFGVTIDSLYKANHLNRQSVLIPGDTIRVLLPEGS